MALGKVRFLWRMTWSLSSSTTGHVFYTLGLLSLSTAEHLVLPFTCWTSVTATSPHLRQDQISAGWQSCLWLAIMVIFIKVTYFAKLFISVAYENKTVGSTLDVNWKCFINTMSYFTFVKDEKALCVSIMDCSPNLAVNQWREKKLK